LAVKEADTNTLCISKLHHDSKAVRCYEVVTALHINVQL